MDEVARHEESGLLAESLPGAPAFSGIPAFDPDPSALTAAIERLADDAVRERLAPGARRGRSGRLSWERTVSEISGLLGSPS